MKKFFTLLAAAATLSAFAGDWAASEPSSTDSEATEVVAAGTVLADNSMVKMTTVFQSSYCWNTVGDQITAVTFGGVGTYKARLNVRVNAAPASSNDWVGTDNGGATSIVIEPVENLIVTLCYRRQYKDDAVTAADGKDVFVLNQSTGKTLACTEFSYEDVDGSYANAMQTFELAKGTSYTVYGRGTTIGLFAIGYEINENAVDEDEDENTTESWIPSDGVEDGNVVNLTTIVATFLDNTSKGSTANAGSWTFGSTATTDQNGLEVEFAPKADGILEIILGAKLASNKSINMYVDGDTSDTMAATVNGTTVESGSCYEADLAAGSVISYELRANHTYNFYCAGTKWSCGGFDYTATGEIQEPGVAFPATCPDNAIAYWYNPTGSEDYTAEAGKFEAEDGTSVNLANNDWQTIRLNGKKDAIESSSYVEVTPSKSISEGDVIYMYAYRNKSTDGTTGSSAYVKFYDNATTVTIGGSDGLEFNDIQTGAEPNVLTYTCTAADAGATSLRITRDKSSTNLFVLGFAITNGNAETSAVSSVAVDADAPVEYYNLSGMRVANPTSGIYIVKQGSKVTKQFIR